jgi:hypothetical protein
MRLISLSLFAFFICLGIKAQEETYSYENELARMTSIPNSPEAQAFEKYGNTSVSMYTGTPNIAVPIHTFKGRELDLPISLTYDASGVKVEQIASQAGLGWNLNVGGRISRLANGYPDDYISSNPEYFTHWDGVVQPGINVQQGILDYYENSTSFNSAQEVIDFLTFMKLMNENKLDTQPDYFSLNAMGISDDIVIDVASKQAYALNNPRITVTYTTTTTGSHNSITGWTVTNEDGTKLYFSLAETTDAVNGDIELSGYAGIVKEYNSSWVLTRIESPNKKDTYALNYTSPGYWIQQRANYAQHVSHDINDRISGAQIYQVNSTPASESYYSIKQQFLTSIEYSTDDGISFKNIVSILLKNRNDLDIASAIDEIQLHKLDTLSTIYKKFRFSHTYFGEETSNTPAADLNMRTHLRLKLDELIIESGLDSIYQKYSFDYESPQNVPSRLSLGQDYLGYYNGKNSNPVLYPRVKIGDDIYLGADRNPSFNFAKIGLMKKITYPTGGYTEFEFEPHKTIYNTSDKAKDEEEQQTTIYGQLALTGGTDYEINCGACCQDQFGGPPKVASTTFKIDTAGNYNLTYSFTGGSGIFNDAFLFYNTDIIPNLFGIGTGGCPINQDLTYDEIIDQTSPGCSSNINLIWQKADGYTQTVFLQPGCYQFTLVSKNEGEISQVTLSQDAVQYSGVLGEGEVPRAGIRIKSIKDYTSQNVLGLQKDYKYTDTITSANSSGVIEFQPQLTYYGIREIIANVEDIDPINGYGREGFVGINTINKVASSSGGNRPHIVYPKVYEIQKDYTQSSENPNGYAEYNFYTGRSGIFSYGVPPNANYYVSDYKVGKPKDVHVFSAENDKLTQEHTDYIDYSPYFVNPGLFLENIPGNTHKYPIIYEDSNGKFKYKLVRGSLLGNSITGLFLVPPLVYLNPNTECNYSFPLEIVYDDGPCPDQPTSYCSYYNNLGFNYNCDLSTEYSTFSMRITSAGAKVGATVRVEKKEFYENGEKIQITDFEHDEEVDYLLRKVTTTASDQDTIATKYFYPKDNVNGPSALNAQNRFSEVVKVESYKNNELLFTKENAYFSSGNVILPSIIKTEKGGVGANLEDRAHFEYYNNGNLRETYQENGPHTVYIWGYDDMYPVAVVQNSTYADIEALADFGEAFNLGSEGLSSNQESSLRTNLPLALVTTYTYDPLVGISNTTDPRGYTDYYNYDQFNRLLNIKDKAYKLIQEFNYGYRDENYIDPDGSVISNQSPTASISANPLQGTSPLVVSFYGGGSTDDVGVTNYLWDFGDGNSATSENPVHTFNNPNTYTITLTVTDGEGLTDISTTTVSAYGPLTQPSLLVNNNKTDIVLDEQVGFTAVSAAGGSTNKVFRWYVDNALQTGQNGLNFIYDGFSTQRDYVIKFEVYDLITFESVFDTATIHVYNPISVSTNSTYEGQNVSWAVSGDATPTIFNAQVTGGSNSYSFSWAFQRPDNSYGAGVSGDGASKFFDSTYVNGTTRFTCTVTDTKTGEVVTSTENNITVYSFPSLSPINSNDWAIINQLANFTVSASGGSANYTYQWTVDGPNTTPLDLNDDTDNLYYLVPSNYIGETVISCTVTDDITGKIQTSTKTIDVYDLPELLDSDITTPSPVTVNSNTYFNVATANGGSGSYEYEWDVISEHTPQNTYGFTNRSEANRNVSSFQMTYDYYGTTTIQCRVHDLITGEYSTASKQIIVEGAPPLSSFLLLNTDTDAAPDSGAYRITAGGVSGGSGDSSNYEYTFYVNNIEVQKSSSNIYEYLILNCNQSGANSSATVRCDVRDILTGGTSTKTSTIDLDYNCNGGGNQ